MYTFSMTTLQQLLQEKPKKHIIFDFDETIFTLDLPWHVYYAEMSLRLHQLDPSLPETHSITELENMAAEKLGMTAQHVRWQYSLEFETEQLKGVEELHDLTDFIRDNSAKYSYYLWTSNMRQTVEPILAKHDLLSLFKKLATKGDVRFTKPSPDGFSLLHEGYNQDLGDWLMVGNSIYDQVAAERAGIDFWMRPE